MRGKMKGKMEGKMKRTSWRNPVLLLITAAIWGFAFVAQSVSMDYIGCFTFNCVRNLMGGLVLIPCIFLLDRINGVEKRQEGPKSEAGRKQERKTLLLGGVCCGVLLCLASNLQQMGIQYTTVGKAGFITTLYIVIVPVLGLFFGKKCGAKVWVSVLTAVAGFYLLSVKDGFRLEKADTCLLLSALLFSFHILTIDYFSPKTDGVKMSCIQFFVCGILSGIVMLFTEQPTLAGLLDARLPLLYAGILSCGVAYTLQIVGQRGFHPTVASLILSLESVFSVLAGWLILDQMLSGRELAGCVLIFCAVILAQIPGKRRTGRQTG